MSLSASIATADTSYEVGVRADSGAVTASTPVGISNSWLDDLNRLATYREDWDGAGARPPAPAILRSAWQLVVDLWRIDSVLPPNRIAASSRGSVILEWQHAGAYLEAEIEPAGQIEWMLQNADGSFSHGRSPWLPAKTQNRPHLLSELVTHQQSFARDLGNSAITSR